MAGDSRAASSERGMRGSAPSHGAKAAQTSLSIKLLKFSFHTHVNITTLEHLGLLAMNEMI